MFSVTKVYLPTQWCNMMQTELKIQKQPPEVLCKKGVLKIFAKFTGKHLCQGLFFNKAAGLKPFHTFAKFLRTPILQYTFRRLLLKINLWLIQKRKKIKMLFRDFSIVKLSISPTTLLIKSYNFISPAILLIKDSNTGVFLWILRNFHEQVFLQNTFGGYF